MVCLFVCLLAFQGHTQFLNECNWRASEASETLSGLYN